MSRITSTGMNSSSIIPVPCPRRTAAMPDNMHRDKRTLAELKKILEIEGLLDTYGHLLEDEKNGQQRYPVNNYSGLNSLRED